MSSDEKEILKSPIGLAALAGLIGFIALLIAWGLGRDSGLGWLGSLIALFSLELQVFTGKVVWDLRRRYVRQAVLTDGVYRLKRLMRSAKIASEDKDSQKTKYLLGAILGVLESIWPHVEHMADVQSSFDGLKAATNADGRSFPRLSTDAISQADRLLEIVRTQIQEIEWGGADD